MNLDFVSSAAAEHYSMVSAVQALLSSGSVELQVELYRCHLAMIYIMYNY